LAVENAKLTDVADVGFEGLDTGAIVTADGTGSRMTTETVPVSAGPPGSNG
jgi:hypothetical protein